MKNSILTKSILLAASLPLLAGCVVYERQPAVVVAQPAPQVEAQPVAPGPLTVWLWVPGAYEWRRGGWVWIPGRWARRPHPGAVWIGGGWVVRGHGRVWVGGHWQ